MINIKDKKECCGCSACASICTKHCITMKEDNEGFLYPQVDLNTCINCGLCEKVCNELHPYDSRVPLQVFAAINENEEVRLRSSSGGIFYILAEKTIREGGIVFGARFDEKWQVVIDYADDIKGVVAFMGSKYVQARIDKAYVNAKRFLVEGRQVLFSGTPCQVAGLHKFLRKSYSNLITVDFICHGTPSPKVWGMYLDEVIKKSQRISRVEFRNKEKGWKKFCFNLKYNEDDNTISLLSPYSENHYMKAFLSDIILRPSCYACKAKACSSLSDITIADFWGIETVFPEMDDDKGTGLVFVNTESGKAFLDLSQMKVCETTYDRIKSLNSACYQSTLANPNRKTFFKRLGNEDLIPLIKDCTKPPFEKRVRMFERLCKSFVKKIIKTAFWGGNMELNKFSLPKEVLSLPADFQIVSVCFRSKDNGWKMYNIEIKIK